LLLLSGLLLLSSCNQQCEGIGCNIEPIQSNLLLFLTPESAISDRTPQQAALTIQGNQSHEYNWGLSIDSSNNLWLGTQDGSIFQIPYQIGTRELETETAQTVFSNQAFAQALLYLEGDLLLISNPKSDYSETILDSGSIEIFSDFDFSSPVLSIKETRSFSLFPSKLWNCGDLDDDGINDWIASTKEKAILGLSSIWQTSTAELLTTEFPSILAENSTDGFAQKIDCTHDFDSDGSIDIVISSPFRQGDNSSGKISFYINGWENSPFIWLPTDGQHWYGYSFAIGDLNGDETLDLSIFLMNKDNPRLEISSLTEQFGLELRTFLESDQTTSFFGKRQEIADINQDGFDDLILSAPFYTNLEKNYTESGRIFIFYGQAEITGITTKIDTFSGEKDYQRLGEDFWLYDFNQDGRLDLLTPVLFP
jgi:hypothetical protein